LEVFILKRLEGKIAEVFIPQGLALKKGGSPREGARDARLRVEEEKRSEKSKVETPCTDWGKNRAGRSRRAA
jgi:hypothetical protein